MPTMPSTDENHPEWTYTIPGQPGSADVDVVRFYMQDTDPSMPLLPDAEIQYLIDVWMPKHDSLIYVAAVAAERVAAKFTGVINVTADGVAVNVADISTRYLALAEQLRATHKDGQVGGEIDLANLMAGTQPDWSIDPLSFGVGMHDNLEAGRQDYGSHRGEYGPYGSDTVRPGG